MAKRESVDLRAIWEVDSIRLGEWVDVWGQEEKLGKDDIQVSGAIRLN